MTEEQVFELKTLYALNHRRSWLFQKLNKRFRREILAVKVLSSLLIVSGTVAGSLTLNPAVISVISGAGVLLKTILEVKNYPKKVEMSHFTEKKKLTGRQCPA